MKVVIKIRKCSVFIYTLLVTKRDNDTKRQINFLKNIYSILLLDSLCMWHY